MVVIGLLPGKPDLVAKQWLAPTEYNSKDCNRTTTWAERRDGPHCVLARFPKTGGTLVSHMLKTQDHTITVRENGALRPIYFKPNTYVMGQIRHPLDWYSSLWSYLSDAATADMPPYKIYQNGVPEPVRETLSKEVPRGSTDEDVRRFRSFVRLYTEPEIGAFSFHFWVNYIDVGKLIHDIHITLRPVNVEPELLKLAAQGIKAFAHTTSARTKHDVGLQQIACWVRQEDLIDSLESCLADCEHAQDAQLVNWDCLEASRDLVINPSTSRVANSVLYDKATEELVQARDGHLLAYFGYNASDTSRADRRLWMHHGDERLSQVF